MRKQSHLVVLGDPALGVVVLLPPLLVLGQGEEGLLDFALGELDDGRDELDQETLEFEKRWEEEVEEVDEETLDVRSIMILEGR